MNRKALIRTQDNYVYINSTIYNDTDQNIVAEYDTTFTSNVVEDSGEFYLTIVRFDIPNTLPIFEFQDDTYYVTMSFGGNDYSVPLLMNNVDTPASNQIYTFQQFVDSINIGLQTAFDNLKAAFPAAPPTEAPYIVFNHNEDYFSLYAQQLYDPIVAGGPTIELFFNYNLYSFFYNSFKVENLGVNLANRKDYRFIINNEKNNVTVTPANYYEIRQQITTLYLWYDFQQILFTTSSLPISSEFVATKRSDGKSILQPILTDFIPELNKDRSNFIYNADPYRLVDMNGHSAISKFDYRILYVNKNGDVRPLTLPPKYSISIKFAFIRKEYIQNNFF